MKCEPLKPVEARIATLTHKLAIAESRAAHGRTRLMRREQEIAASAYRVMLAETLREAGAGDAV